MCLGAKATLRHQLETLTITMKYKLMLIQNDNNKDAHLIIYVRFCDDVSAVEELLFCKTIELGTSEYVLMVYVTMSERMHSLQALAQQKSTVCMVCFTEKLWFLNK